MDLDPSVTIRKILHLVYSWNFLVYSGRQRDVTYPNASRLLRIFMMMLHNEAREYELDLTSLISLT